MLTRAIVRPPADTLARGLTTASFGAPVMPLARAQHVGYCDALAHAGLTITCLPPLPAYPDSTFVEDTAVLTTRAAVLTRPGADVRRGEVITMRDALMAFYAAVETIDAPGTVDGGDVCQAENHFFIGISARTNEAGARQLARLLAAHGHTTSFVVVDAGSGLLHLKSGLSYIGDQRVVLDAALASHAAFKGYERIVAEPGDGYATNCIRVNAHLIVPSGYPRIEASLGQLGYALIVLPMSEFRRMDGGLSCLSLRF
jgi:dimethylargininase